MKTNCFTPCSNGRAIALKRSLELISKTVLFCFGQFQAMNTLKEWNDKI